MNDSTGLTAGLITFVVIVLLYLWASLALAAVFRKAGEDAWQAWVPVLNTAVLLRLGGFSPWLVFIVFIPLLGQIAFVVLLVMSYYRINRAFGFGVGMTVLAALLPLIWASVVGFGSARWLGQEAAGPRRSGETRGDADAAVASRAGAFASFEPMFSGPVVPARAEDPPSTPGAAPLTAGFWAPAPQAGTPAASFPAPAPSPAEADVAPVDPPAGPPVLPPPTSFLAARPAAPTPEADDSAVDPGDRAIRPPLSSSTFLPPPPSDDSEPLRRTSEPVAPIESVPSVPPRTAPAPTPEPVTEVPAPSVATPEPEPWAPAPFRAAPPTTRDPEQFPELSEAISAIPGAPDAGAPMSARSSVSALYADGDAEGDDDDLEAMDRTIVARRRRVPWKLIPPGGAPVDISSEVVILGRRPSPDPTRPGAQLIAISDETRTVSKTHARLELRGETWFVTDLHSTNGVLFATLMGTEIEAQPGQELEAGDRFFLGDAEVRLKRSDA